MRWSGVLAVGILTVGACGSGAPAASVVVASAVQSTLAAHSAHVVVTIQLAENEPPTVGTGSVDFAANAVEIVFDGPGVTEVVIIGNDVYERGGSGGWTHRQEPSGLDQRLRTGGDPRELLAALRSASASVHVVGSERVDGLEANHIHADIPMATQGGGADSRSFPAELWIAGGHVVRIEWGPPGAATVTTVTGGIREDFSEFGVPVNIQAPV